MKKSGNRTRNTRPAWVEADSVPQLAHKRAAKAPVRGATPTKKRAASGRGISGNEIFVTGIRKKAA